MRLPLSGGLALRFRVGIGTLADRIADLKLIGLASQRSPAVVAGLTLTIRHSHHVFKSNLRYHVTIGDHVEDAFKLAHG